MFAEVKAATPGSAQWWQARLRSTTSPSPRAGALSMEAIADATIRLIDRIGLPDVTMRRVAEELGTGAASLYRHIASRDELLVLVADKALEAAGEVTDYEGLTWRQLCERAAHGYRELLLRRPAVAALLDRSQLLGPNSLRGREIMLRELLARDFPPALAVHTYLAVVHYVMGSVRLDERSTKRDPGERRALKTLFADLDPEQFPTIVELAGILGGLEPDDEFEFGLQALLDGISAKLERGG